jgi:N utilization substance protein B
MTGSAAADRKDRRSAARLAAVQALYEIDITGATFDGVLREFLDRRWIDTSGEATAGFGADLDEGLFKKIVGGVADDLAALDGMVAGALSAEWTVARLEVLVRAVLRAGAFELSTSRDVPSRVVINEYVDVAHAFFAGGEPGLVNGVLDRLARVLRADEMESANGEAATDQR